MHLPYGIEPLLLRLWCAGAVKIDLQSGFKLKYHEDEPWKRPSPIKLALATRTTRPDEGVLEREDIEVIGKALWRRAEEKKLHYAGVAGVPNAGNDLAKAFVAEAYHSGLGREVSRLTLEKMTHIGNRHVGKLLAVSPDLPRGDRVLLLDDVATKAESKEETAERLRHEDYKVTDCLVFVDRQEGAARNLEKIHVRLHSVLTLGQMVSFYHEHGFIGDDAARYLRAYMEESAAESAAAH